jgi:hypothetical protein
MMLSSRSDEFGLVHERRDETGETDTRRDGSQVRTTRHLHGKRLSRPNEHDRAEREDELSQWQHRRQNEARMRHFLEEDRKERNDRRL